MWLMTVLLFFQDGLVFLNAPVDTLAGRAARIDTFGGLIHITLGKDLHTIRADAALIIAVGYGIWE